MKVVPSKFDDEVQSGGQSLLEFGDARGDPMTGLDGVGVLCLSMPKAYGRLAADPGTALGIGQIVLDPAISRSRNGSVNWSAAAVGDHQLLRARRPTAPRP